MKMIRYSGPMSRVVPVGSFIGYAEKATITEVLYNYLNTSSTSPASGFVNNASASVILRFSPVDANGINRAAGLDSIVVGDVIAMGANSQTVTLEPIWDGTSWRTTMDAWPTLADGQYTVTVTKAFISTFDEPDSFVARVVKKVKGTRGKRK